MAYNAVRIAGGKKMELVKNKYKAKKLFGGVGSEEYQAIYDAIHYCGEKNCMSDLGDDAEPKDRAYEWLGGTPRTSLSCELVNELHEMGFKIVKALIIMIVMQAV